VRLNGDRFVAAEDSIAKDADVSVIANQQGKLTVEDISSDADYESGRWSESMDARWPGYPWGLTRFSTSVSTDLLAQASQSRLEIFNKEKSLQDLIPAKTFPQSHSGALCDHEGSLWIGTNGGLARWVEGKVQRLPVTDPLASASVLALMEDREGNLWVGTETGGLHILRDQRFRTLGTREGSLRFNDCRGRGQGGHAVGGNEWQRAECNA